jgi:hypothetical protein
MRKTTKRFAAIGFLALALTFGAWLQAGNGSAVIDFSGIPAGTIVDEIFSGYGVTGSLSGTIGVNGYNPGLSVWPECANKPPCNAAVVFDSSNPPGIDFDLGTPHNCAGGPGIDKDFGDGFGGECGSPFENVEPLGNILIVNERAEFIDRDASQTIDTNDSPVTLTDDADLVGQFLEFDFTDLKGGDTTVNSVTYMDNDEGEFGAQIELYGPDLAPNPNVIGIPAVGDNGVNTLDIGLPGVTHMKVLLNGSGAVTTAVIEERIRERPCWVTTGGFDTGTLSDPSGKKICTWGGNIGPPSSGAFEVNWHMGPLSGAQFHTNDIWIIECVDEGSTGPQQPGGKKGLEVDTLYFECTGLFNHESGYTCEGFLKDAGQPQGKKGNDRDEISMTVRDGGGAIVAECIGDLEGGKVQIHPPVGNQQ